MTGSSFPSPRAKKQVIGLIDHSLSLGTDTSLQGWGLSRLVLGGLAAAAPGDLRAPELSMLSTHSPLVNCRIHRLLGSTSQSCASSWILCHLAVCRQLCKTARSFLIWCQCQRAWNSVSIFPFFPFSPQVLCFAYFPCRSPFSPQHLSVLHLWSSGHFCSPPNPEIKK